MLAVVLAAGRGTRLGPLTANRSKAMMPIAGKTMLERVLELLVRGGAERFIVVAHPGDLDLLHAVSRAPWASRIQLAYQERRLGMVDALQAADPLIREEGVSDFMLASCDSIYPRGHVAKLMDHHYRAALDATLTLMSTSPEKATASAVVMERDGSIQDVIEKPSVEEIPQRQGGNALTAPSLYALSLRVLRYLARVAPSARGEYEFPDVLRLLIDDGGAVGGVRVDERMTLTEPDDLLAINRYFLRHDPGSAVIEARIPADVTVVPPVRIERGVCLSSGSEIGPEVYLESGCSVREGAIIRRAIVLQNGVVKAGQLVEGTVISANG